MVGLSRWYYLCAATIYDAVVFSETAIIMGKMDVWLMWLWGCCPVVRLLTRALCNVLYVRVGELIVCLWRPQRSQMTVWGGSQWDGRCPPLAPQTRPAHTQTEPQLEPATSAGVIFLDNSCCYARYSCGNNCNVVVKLVQEYHFFTFYFLQKQFRRKWHVS